MSAELTIKVEDSNNARLLLTAYDLIVGEGSSLDADVLWLLDELAIPAVAQIVGPIDSESAGLVPFIYVRAEEARQTALSNNNLVALTRRIKRDLRAWQRIANGND